MRMFWACTHVMLKLTEIPLFLDLGIEIIPTEVTPNVMNYLEGIKYDDPDLAINKMWRTRCTLPDDVLIAIIRSRLWERDGLISEAEQEIFNQYIDVIYIPTRLDLATKISRWFKGSIVYRYFGDLLEGKNYLLNIPESDLKIIRNMVYLPIFNSLMKEELPKYFDTHIVLHNYLDESIVPKKWSGFKKDSHAVIVLGSVHQFPPFQKILRELIPLAKIIPIKLLGKNVYSLLPKDIKEAFDVKTDLDRDEFFNEFFSSQFLIYPHTRKNHSHNVPIEAIYGGMPILFRTKTPTFIENEHDLKTKIFPSKIGAAHTLIGFRKLILKTYNNANKLEYLTKVQSPLTTPYSAKNVHSEAKRLIEHLKKIKRERADPISEKIPLIPLTTFPANLYFYNLKNVVNDDFSAPIHQFFSNSILNGVKIIEFEGKKHTVLNLKNAPNHTQLILGVIPGAESVYFCADKEHEITLDGFIFGTGRCDIFLDAYVKDIPVKRLTQRERSNTQTLMFFSKKFIINNKEPFHLSIVIKVHGKCTAYANIIKHSISTETKIEKKFFFDEWIYANEIGETIQDKTTGTDVIIIPSRSDPLQLIPFSSMEVNNEVIFNYNFKFIDEKIFKTNITIEYWEECRILLTRIHSFDSSVNDIISDEINFDKKANIKPIIYIHSSPKINLQFISVRIQSINKEIVSKKKITFNDLNFRNKNCEDDFKLNRTIVSSGSHPKQLIYNAIIPVENEVFFSFKLNLVSESEIHTRLDIEYWENGVLIDTRNHKIKSPNFNRINNFISFKEKANIKIVIYIYSSEKSDFFIEYNEGSINYVKDNLNETTKYNEWLYADDFEHSFIEKNTGVSVVSINQKNNLLQLIPGQPALTNGVSIFSYKINFIRMNEINSQVIIEYWEKNKIKNKTFHNINSPQDTEIIDQIHFGRKSEIKPIIYILNMNSIDLLFESVNINHYSEIDSRKSFLVGTWIYNSQNNHSENKPTKNKISPLQLISARTMPVNEEEVFNFNFNFSSNIEKNIKIVIEYWDDKKILNKTLHDIYLSKNINIIERINFGKSADVKPVVYIFLNENMKSLFESLYIFLDDKTKESNTSLIETWIHSKDIDNEIIPIQSNYKFKPKQFIALRTMPVKNEGVFYFKFNFISKKTVTTKIVIEYWIDKEIIEKRSHNVIFEKNLTISDRITIKGMNDVRPVIYIFPEKKNIFYFESVRIWLEPVKPGLSI